MTIAIAGLITTVILSPATARDWNVPADAPTISAGIDSAETGDVVIIAPGTYTGADNVGLSFDGKAITVTGAMGADDTIIDCVGQSSAGFWFFNDEGTDSVLRNVTIRNGAVGGNGGGILISHASPTITGCVIEDCSADLNGGGIYVAVDFIGGFEASPVIQFCTIRNCSAIGGPPLIVPGGGGIAVELASPIITDNEIYGNSAPHGAGVLLSVELGLVGGTITNNIIHSNTASTRGGGLEVYNSSSEVVITGNTVYGNSAATDGGGMYFSLVNSGITVHTNTVVDNTAPGEGAGVYMGEDMALGRTIVAFNNGTAGRQALYCFDSTPTVNCCLVWNPTLDDSFACQQSGGSVNADPQFCGSPGSGDYRIQSDSPARPAASPCGERIGAWDVECGEVPTLETTWGRIKSEHR